MSKATKVVIVIAGLVFSAACGGATAGTEPDDMSADEHRAAASAEDEEASGHHSRETEAVQSLASRTTNVNIAFDIDLYDPRVQHAATEEEHRHLADQHREAAEALEVFEEAECGSFPVETRVLCPLLGQLHGVENVPGGVKLTFDDDVNIEAVKAHVRCHHAFARASGRQGMEHCPMYLEGVSVSEDDAGALQLTTEVSGVVRDVRRSARAHVVH